MMPVRGPNQTLPLLPSAYPTKYWHPSGKDRVTCDLCPRACEMGEGQRGLCFVRACQGGEVVLSSFGRSSGYCVDPIEKKPLNHFLPGTPVLSFGTAGCNLTCKFCQNWDISKSRETDTLADHAPPELIAAAAAKLGCRSVAFTYNDPVIFLEYAVETARACHAAGIKTVAVTAGYICERPRRELFSHIDAANIDLKAFSERFYRRLCGGGLAACLDTLIYLHHETDVWLEVTTLLIPGENDSDGELEAMSAWFAANLGAEVPWHFSAFHPDYRMLDRRPTSPASLSRAREVALGRGIHHVYTGNVRDEAGSSSYCRGCGSLAIGRDRYRLTAWNLDGEGRCRACGVTCPGLFEARPGDWGPKRLPVRLADFAV